MKITYDDQFLLTVSEDGCLLISKIVDKEGRRLKSNIQAVQTEEILITKADLDEKVSSHYVDLVTSVQVNVSHRNIWTSQRA